MTRSIDKLDTSSLSELDTLDALDLGAMHSSSGGAYITPDALYTLYGIESSLISDLQRSSVSQSVASFNQDYWSDDDLVTAWNSMGYISGNALDQMTRDPSRTDS